jgi:hypothetical protein
VVPLVVQALVYMDLVADSDFECNELVAQPKEQLVEENLPQALDLLLLV